MAKLGAWVRCDCMLSLSWSELPAFGCKVITFFLKRRQFARFLLLPEEPVTGGNVQILYWDFAMRF